MMPFLHGSVRYKLDNNAGTSLLVIYVTTLETCKKFGMSPQSMDCLDAKPC